MAFLLAVGGWSQPVQAQTIIAADCESGDFRTQFGDNQCVGAWVNSASFAEAIVCVVPRGKPASEANDVTVGGCNTVSFGLQLIPVWLPPLKAGQYDIVVLNQSGGEARETISVSATGGAVPTVNVAAIKSAAGQMAEPWEKVAARGAALNDNSTEFAIVLALGTGDFLSAGVNLFGRLTGFPVDYNDAVLAAGGKAMAALSKPMGKQYRDIEKDPPDTNFTSFAALNISPVNQALAATEPVMLQLPLAYPFQDRSENALARAQVALANRMSLESILAGALLATLEKLQGAEQVTNRAYIYLQARLLGRHADMLKAQQGLTRLALLDYKSALTDRGVANIVYNGDTLASTLQRLLTGGLNDDERRRLKATGFGDADLQHLLDELAGLTSPPGTFTRAGLIDAILATHAGSSNALTQMATKTGEMLTYCQSRFTLEHPTAVPGGPYTGTQGTGFPLNASGSSDPQSQTLTFTWDFDLDGAFDDASGPSPTFTASKPIDGLIGLRVTDPNGNSDVAYTSVKISRGNRSPVLTGFLPTERLPLASPANPVLFQATATDADGDPLSYEWRLDGQVVSAGPSWTYTPAAGETGFRNVVLHVRDNSPLSEDTIELRQIALASPEIELIRLDSTNSLIWFLGLAEQSSDLEHWSLLNPQPPGPFKLRTDSGILFLRSRSRN